MMKSKRYLKSLARPALLLSLAVLTALPLCGCSKPIEPTYKEENMPDIVKQICRDEYALDVTTTRTENTLWIYAPISKMIHKEYGIKEDKLFDDEMLTKLRNVLTVIGRVLVSADKTPEFFALVAADVNLGLEYMLVGTALDIKKSYAASIPWTEANRRFVVKLKLVPEAVGDLAGTHLNTYDIKLPDFLADQIAQRINAHFQEENLKKYFKVQSLGGRYSGSRFIIDYTIEQIMQPDKEIDVRKEVLGIVAYCISTYEFKDFSEIQLIDAFKQAGSILTRQELSAIPAG